MILYNQYKNIKKDEFECYKWAMERSGVDPINIPKTQAAPAQEGNTGAAIGAVAGGLAGRRKGKQAQAQLNQ